MKIVLIVLFVYWVGISGVTFFLYGWDKRQAIHHSRRIPERTLLLLSAMGGSAAALVAMSCFHHKTRHWRFLLLNPLFLLCNVAVLILLLHLFP